MSEPTEPEDAGCADDSAAVLAADEAGDEHEPEAEDIDVEPQDGAP
jgi:hypothetical protein